MVLYLDFLVRSSSTVSTQLSQIIVLGCFPVGKGKFAKGHKDGTDGATILQKICIQNLLFDRLQRANFQFE